MHILFEDNHILVAEKPAGLPSQMTPDGQDGAEDILRKMLEERAKKPKQFLHAVHRLDRPVSGIILLAKTSKALSRLSEAIREKKMTKQYLALVEGGKALLSNDTLVDFLVHGNGRAHIDPREGKRAELHILKITPQPENRTLVLLNLLTGRYHQIRIQLSSRHAPIVGDTLYGSTYSLNGNIRLHHCFLSFPHPTLGKEIVIHSKPIWNEIK